VGAPFFNAATAPLAIPLVAAMAVGPLLAWKRADLAGALQRLWWVGLLAVAAAFLTLLIAGYHVWPALGFAAAAWLIAGAAADILDRIAAFRRPSQAWNRARGLPRAAWGGAIAHAGVGVMFAGLAGMGLATDSLVELKPGQSTRLAGYEWRLENIRDVQGPNWSSRRATITVLENGRVVTVLTPEKRFFPVGRMHTTEAAIHTNAIRDLYAVLGDERDGGGVVRLHHNPLAPWIWFGAGIMALGGGLSLSDRRIRVSAPSRKAAPAPA
jgi:cytochrome c-type biogenesis protein CcmF